MNQPSERPTECPAVAPSASPVSLTRSACCAAMALIMTSFQPGEQAAPPQSAEQASIAKRTVRFVSRERKVQFRNLFTEGQTVYPDIPYGIHMEESDNIPDALIRIMPEKKPKGGPDAHGRQTYQVTGLVIMMDDLEKGEFHRFRVTEASLLVAGVRRVLDHPAVLPMIESDEDRLRFTGESFGQIVEGSISRREFLAAARALKDQGHTTIPVQGSITIGVSIGGYGVRHTQPCSGSVTLKEEKLPPIRLTQTEAGGRTSQGIR